VLKQLQATTTEKIRVCSRKPEQLKDLAAKGIEVVAADFSDKASLNAIFKDVTALFLNVPIVEDMVEQHANAVQAAKSQGVRHIVKLSVMGTEFRDSVEKKLLNAHFKGETIIRESGVGYTILRPNAFHQNFTTYHGAEIASVGKMHNICGRGKISFIDVRDIAKIIAKAMTETEKHHNKTYSISGPEAISYAEAAAMITEITGKPVAYVNLPYDAMASALLGYGLSQFYVDCVMNLYENFAGGWHSLIIPSTEDLLGCPPIPLKTALREMFASLESASAGARRGV